MSTVSMTLRGNTNSKQKDAGAGSENESSYNSDQKVPPTTRHESTGASSVRSTETVKGPYRGTPMKLNTTKKQYVVPVLEFHARYCAQDGVV